MIIAPSILTANFNDLAHELKSISKAKLIHLDIMDGHFVPNISFGPHISCGINAITNVPLDVHLMVARPLDWVGKFVFDKVEYITVHVESEGFLDAIKLIKQFGKKAGISLRPSTDIGLVVPYLNDVDLVLVMTVEPGFGGQAFKPEMLERIILLDEKRDENKYSYLIQVDGGMNAETVAQCQKVGVDICVVGSYLFNSKNRNQTIIELEK